LNLQNASLAGEPNGFVRKAFGGFADTASSFSIFRSLP
jgi:hypothetical protein